MKHITTKPTENQFLKDIKKHRMTIKQDAGVYRHLHFQNPDLSWNQWFDIVTWPGYLAYTGDMGCFVFSRINDMFQFFRTKPSGNSERLFINQSYWGEKLEAVDRDGSKANYRQFSPDKMREHIHEVLKEWSQNMTRKLSKQLRDEVKWRVLDNLDLNEEESRYQLNDFEITLDGETYKFSDTWEWDCEEYTFRFTWCCYAIAWAIKQYDGQTIISVPEQSTDLGILHPQDLLQQSPCIELPAGQ